MPPDSMCARYSARMTLVNQMIDAGEEIERETRQWIRQELQEGLKKLQRQLDHLHRLDREEILRQRQVARDRRTI